MLLIYIIPFESHTVAAGVHNQDSIQMSLTKRDGWSLETRPGFIFWWGLGIYL